MRVQQSDQKVKLAANASAPDSMQFDEEPV